MMIIIRFENFQEPLVLPRIGTTSTSRTIRNNHSSLVGAITPDLIKKSKAPSRTLHLRMFLRIMKSVSYANKALV